MEDIRHLLQLITRRFGFLNKNCCSVGGVDVSLIQSHILYEIDRQHHPSMQQIADTLGMDITTFSRQVQSLIRKKLVKKSASDQDRRVYILELTTEGKFVAAAIDKQVQDDLTQIFSHMNEFEKETVIRSLKLLNACMEKTGVCCN
ncbi:MarR family winged helix-turn-helix transcriptional regulator [Paenibacillus thermoaerophilus]|uniref:MarR family winged helix-turn-helix transcriptional regulator n=1 Tax=Paenibacillus thermoaerophilus TaxID=1215385 RepID=A0ABW2V336_9BACL|nr:MarR family winged helix-turn-helix transcriptional regulator [Paenibacillus thermoaerophilus]TMV09401.1 winged helix-turn-helix transcriptional regulator [Paenibacillus thermoaerophilus]